MRVLAEELADQGELFGSVVLPGPGSLCCLGLSREVYVSRCNSLSWARTKVLAPVVFDQPASHFLGSFRCLSVAFGR